MANYNTLGHNLKRGIIIFCGKLSNGFGQANTKIHSSLIAGKSCFLTEIARSLIEDIALDKTVERLSRNLMSFDAEKELIENYFDSVKKHFDESTVLIIDDGDV